jgi:hypothetical protein
MSAAFGGAGVVNTVVSPLQDKTTYSKGGAKPLTTYVAFQVNVSNDGGNTVNNIRFTAKSEVTGGVGPALYNSAEGASCVPTSLPTEVTCTIGQLTANSPAAPIVLFFIAPADDTADPPGGDFVKVTGTTFYAEGTGGINSPPDNSIRTWGSVQVPLGTPDPIQVKSAVPKAGGQFFTGGGGVPTSADVYASEVKFDPLSAFAVMNLEESDATDAKCIGGQHFKSCFKTLLNAPQVQYSVTGGYLTEVIRMHADNFVQGAKMNTVTWEYTPTDADGNASGGPVNVQPCASPTTPRTDGIPCQAAPPVCFKKNAGDYCEWTFLNKRNGFQRGY